MATSDDNPLDDDLPMIKRKTSKKPRKSILATRLKKPRKPRNEVEHKIQVAFFFWARKKSTLLEYPLFDKLLFAVPNGGQRSAKTGQALKDEGVEAGVSDVLFLISARGYPYLCIEFKAPKATQSTNQKDFEREVDKVGGLYQIVYSETDAKDLIRWYYADIKL